MKYQVEIHTHCDLSKDKLLEIIDIKSVRWNYSVDQHLDWIKKNIQADDKHILFYLENQLIAYTNLVNVIADINGEKTSFKGIGNVCTLVSGKGYGNLLMGAINDVLTQNNWKGILFCKDHLVKYYEKFSWRVVEKNKIKSNFNEVNIMIFNCELNITTLYYQDRNF